MNAPAPEKSFFDGLDVRPSWYEPIARHVDEALRAFTINDPSTAAPALARGLAALRALAAADRDADRLDVLHRKERQFVDALVDALGIRFSATARTSAPVVPGQTVDVDLHLSNGGGRPIACSGDEISAPGIGNTARRTAATALAGGGVLDDRVAVTVPPDRSFTRPHFSRTSLAENRYAVAADVASWRPRADVFVARAFCRFDEVDVTIDTPVVRREPQPPYGVVTRELTIVPALFVTVSPRQAIVPMAAADRPLRVHVEVTNNSGSVNGQVTIRLPPGWSTTPASVSFAMSRPGETLQREFVVNTANVAADDYTMRVAVTAGGREFTDGAEIIEHRDLETRYLYHPATTHVRGVDVTIAPGLKVGYVMGAGDEVPSGIQQLGADVRLLGARDLASADLGQFDAIVTGTRAYGVRDDLRTYNARLLEYVRAGGNLIVLYNTPAEFDPRQFAPYPATLPRDAEEVSEEDSPVTILARSRPEFTTPNAITTADFDGWVEQRGSKFWSEWDAAYTPMIETHDTGQAPQRGGWLTATYGKGHYTYFAYAFHRQLPYGVPGAYRLLANLLSLSARAPAR